MNIYKDDYYNSNIVTSTKTYFCQDSKQLEDCGYETIVYDCSFNHLRLLVDNL